MVARPGLFRVVRRHNESCRGWIRGHRLCKVVIFPSGARWSFRTHTQKICLEVFSACAELPGGCPLKKKKRNHVWFYLVRQKSGSKCVSGRGFHFFLKHNKCKNIHQDLFDRSFCELLLWRNDWRLCLTLFLCHLSTFCMLRILVFKLKGPVASPFLDLYILL